MKKFFFAVLLAGFASCSNNPEEYVATPDGKQAFIGTAQGDKALAVVDATAGTIDSTVRFTIGDRVIYSGQSIWLANGTYPVNMQFLFNGVWSNLHAAAASTTGDIEMGSLNATTVTVNGSGTLTIMQPGGGDVHVEGTIYINKNTAPVIEGVRLTVDDQVFENGDSLWLQKGTYVVNMQFKINGVWSNPHSAQYTQSGGVEMVDYYPPTMEVKGDGSLTIMQAGQGGIAGAQGTLYIKAVPQEVDTTVRFTIGNQEVYSGQTLNLRKGTYPVNMQFFISGVWSNLHVAGATTTGGICMGSLNATSMDVQGSGTLTISQLGPAAARVTGTVYINAL